MEDFLVKLAGHVPALVVLAYMTLMFIRAQERSVDRLGESLKTVSEACHTVQRDAIEAMRENSKINGRVVEVLARFERKLRD